MERGKFVDDERERVGEQPKSKFFKFQIMKEGFTIST